MGEDLLCLWKCFCGAQCFLSTGRLLPSRVKRTKQAQLRLASPCRCWPGPSKAWTSQELLTQQFRLRELHPGPEPPAPSLGENAADH